MPKIIHFASTSSPPQLQVKRLTWEKLEEEPQKMLDDATCAERQREVAVMSQGWKFHRCWILIYDLAHVFSCLEYTTRS